MSVASLIDLCSSNNVSEVEIISLIGETIPRYKLRADRLTAFAGGDHFVDSIIHPLSSRQSFPFLFCYSGFFLGVRLERGKKTDQYRHNDRFLSSSI